MKILTKKRGSVHQPKKQKTIRIIRAVVADRETKSAICRDI